MLQLTQFEKAFGHQVGFSSLDEARSCFRDHFNSMAQSEKMIVVSSLDGGRGGAQYLIRALITEAENDISKVVDLFDRETGRDWHSIGVFQAGAGFDGLYAALKLK